MSSFPIPAIRKRGPVLNGPTALPATTEMLVLDASGNITTQSIPVASFGALTGNPSDNAALSSALAGKVSLAGDTMTGNLGILSRLTFGGDQYLERVNSNTLDLIQSGASRARISNGEATFTSRVRLTSFNPAVPDIDFMRNATGPSAEIRAAGGLIVNNAAGSANAALTCNYIQCNPISTGSGPGIWWSNNFAMAGNAVYVGNPGDFSGESHGFGNINGGAAAYHRNGAISVTFSSDQIDLGPNRDVSFLRNATGPSIETRSAGGLSVRNADGSNWQTVNAYDGIFFNDVYVGVNRYIGGIGVQGFQFKANSTIATQLGATGRFCLGNDTSTGVALRGNGAGGLEVKLGDNSADAALACGVITASGLVTGTKIVASNGYVYGAPQFYSSAFGSSAGMQIGTSQQVSLYGGGTAIVSFENTSNGIRLDGSRPMGFVNGHALANVSDVTWRRNSTGPALEIRSAGGLIINNTAGSSNAALACGAITASSSVVVTGNPGTYGLLVMTPTNVANYAAFSASGSSDTFSRIAFGFDNGTPFLGLGPGNANRDLFLFRNAAGQLDVRGDSGLRVRNLANSADAALACGAITASGTVNAVNVRCQGGSGIVGTRYINNSNDTWSAFEFPANISAATFSPGGGGGLFRFEGTTSAHVALKRSGATLQARLADDSAFAAIDCGAITASGKIVANGSGGDVIRVVRSGFTDFGIGDADGNSFRIYNNGAGTDLLRIHGTTRAITAYGAITLSGTPKINFDSSGSRYIEYDSGALQLGDGFANVISVGASAITMRQPTTFTSNLTVTPSASVTPANNGQLTFEATSNTSLTVKYKGSDGVVRSNVLTLT